MSFPDPKSRQHCRLELQELINDYQTGFLTATGLLKYAIKVYRQNGHKLYIPSIDDFCKKLNLSKRSFFRAKANLVTLGQLEEEIFGSIALTIVGTESATSGSQSATSGSQSATSGTESATSGTTTLPNPSNSNSFDNPSYGKQLVNISLSDLEEENGQLNTESTKSAGSDSEERENFSDFENQESKLNESLSKNVSSSNGSLSFAKKPKSKNTKPVISSKGKGFGSRCSTNELPKDSLSSELKQLTDLYCLPETVRALKRIKDFPFDEYEGFLKYARERIDEMPKYPTCPDAVVVSKLESYTADYLYQKRKAVNADRSIEEKRRKSVNAAKLNGYLEAAFSKAYGKWLEDNFLESDYDNMNRFKDEVWKTHPVRQEIIAHFNLE